MVEQFTNTPSRAIDIAHTLSFSYLFMTCVPGCSIGQILDVATDEKVGSSWFRLVQLVPHFYQH
jgi:hypothetical protein